MPGTAPAPAAFPEETEKVLRWLEEPGVRLVSVDGEWTCPVGGAVHLAGRYGHGPSSTANPFE
ncbi:hypothetical protein [Nostocoides sp.]|uniref:hypothetical protein n=1 Tax=Nostocoides sp. TaxID=1917966 RepID=UPI003BB187D2